MTNKATRIVNSLRKASLENGPMVKALYEYELAEHIDYWYRSIKKDKEDFALIITENRSHVAIALIESDKTVISTKPLAINFNFYGLKSI